MTTTAVQIVFGLLVTVGSRAQSQAQIAPASQQKYEFDVVSVKPSKSGPGAQRTTPTPDGFTGRNVTVQRLIETAYAIPLGTSAGRILGGPSWLSSERYDIDAKMDGTVADELQKLGPDERNAAQLQMLQALLTERFKLTVQRESKELPIYTLVVAKNGPKLQESKVNETSARATGGPGRGAGTTSRSVRGGQAFQAYSMKRLVSFLSILLERPVVDKTGLTGTYDFTLMYAPGAGGSPAVPGGTANGQPGLAIMDADDSDVISAVQDLGLKLESGKGPVEIIVIKHVEKAADN